MKKLIHPRASTGIVVDSAGYTHYFDVFYLGAYQGRHAVRGPGNRVEAGEKLLDQLASGGYGRYYIELRPV
jgi:hypothetical protein